MADESPRGALDNTQGSQASASNGVLNAKLVRRKLQHDVELLSNRVERLREEERKAKQKVLETRLRGQEITALQKRNEQALTAKALAKRMEEDQLQRERAESRLRRLEEKNALKNVFTQMFDARREDTLPRGAAPSEPAMLLGALKVLSSATLPLRSGLLCWELKAALARTSTNS